jgi:hypothetical protein
MVMRLPRSLELVAGPFDLGRDNPLLVLDLGLEDGDFADKRLAKEFRSFPWARLSQIRSVQTAYRFAPRIQASFLGMAPPPCFPLDMPSRTRCTPLHHLLPAMGKNKRGLYLLPIGECSRAATWVRPWLSDRW